MASTPSYTPSRYATPPPDAVGLHTSVWNEIGTNDQLNFTELLNVTENQKLEWIRTQLKQRKDEYTTVTPLYVMCGSFNVNAKKPPSDLRPWLEPRKLRYDTLHPLHNAQDIAYDNLNIWPDIYAIGFEEIVDLKFGTGASALGNDSKTRTASEHWETGIMNCLGRENYVLLKTKHLVGLSLHVYVKKDLLPHIQDLRTDRCGVGVLGRGGNKGAVCIRFRVHDSSFVFTNVHLAAHASKADKRNQDFHSIMGRIKFPHTHHVNVSVFPFQVVNSNLTATSTVNDAHKIDKLKTHATLDAEYFGEDQDGENDDFNLHHDNGGHINPNYTDNTTTTHNTGTFTMGGKQDKKEKDKKKDKKEDHAPHVKATANANAHLVPQHVNYPASAGLYSQHTQPILKYPTALQQATTTAKKNTPITTANSKDNYSMTIEQHDNCFIFGDCNARLAVPLTDMAKICNTIEECRKLPACNIIDKMTYTKQASALVAQQQPIRYSKLLQYDQLLHAKANGHSFENWSEGIIDFAPTYKYIPGTNKYDQESKRIPGWTDRHMWYVKPEDRQHNSSDVSLLEYTSCENVTISDHFPVRSFYRVAVRTLNIPKKIQLCQLLLKHYFTMQSLALPRVLFNHSVYNVGYIYFNVPVKGSIVLHNPCKRSIYWRLISPYDAKHVVDDHDVKKLLVKNHLSPQPTALTNNQVGVYYKNTQGQRQYQQQATTTTYPNQIDQQHLLHHEDVHNYSIRPYNQNSTTGPMNTISSAFNTNSAALTSSATTPNPYTKQQYQLENQQNVVGQYHTLMNTRRGGPGGAGGPSANIQQSAMFNTATGGGTQLGTNNNNNSKYQSEYFDVNSANIYKDPNIRIPPQQHLYLQHESFQYRHTNKPYSHNSTLAPHPHVVTYLPQRRDPFTNITPSWMRFAQLQGKVEPGGVHTIPYVIHVKGVDALQIVTNHQQVCTNLFFATSFTNLNQNNNMSTSVKDLTGAMGQLKDLAHQSEKQAQMGLNPSIQVFNPKKPAAGGSSALTTGGVHNTTIGPTTTNLTTNTTTTNTALPTTNPTAQPIAMANNNTKTNITLAPTHLSLNYQQQRSSNVNVFMCSVMGTYQYTTYGLSLAYLCDLHDSVRSRQIQQYLYQQHYKQMQQQQQTLLSSSLLKNNNIANSSEEFKVVLNYYKAFYQSGKEREIFTAYGNTSKSSLSLALHGGIAHSRPPQPIPKEMFQLVDALIKTGLDNPNHFIFDDELPGFIQSVSGGGGSGSNSSSTSGQKNKDGLVVTAQPPTSTTTTTKPAAVAPTTAPQLPPRPAGNKQLQPSKIQLQQQAPGPIQSQLTNYTAPQHPQHRLVLSKGLIQRLKLNRKLRLQYIRQNFTNHGNLREQLGQAQQHYISQQRLIQIAPCANPILQAALVTCIDEQQPIVVQHYVNTPYIWFTLLDLLYNLPEPLFPLVLIDKIAKFRQTILTHEQQNLPDPQVLFGGANNNNNNAQNKNAAPKGISGPILSTFGSPTQHKPTINPYSLIKHFPRPIVQYHQQLYQQQYASLMSTFCFYLLKWLPLQHYNLLLYLLALVKKIISSLAQKYKEVLRAQLAQQDDQHPAQYKGLFVDYDVDMLKRYILTKFTQAACQIKSLHFTNNSPFPLAIISHMIDHDVL